MGLTEPSSAEWRLVSASAKTTTSDEDEAAIRALLELPIDWTLFAQTAIENGAVSRAAHTLLRVASDMIPGDIVGAMRTILEQTQTRNREVLGKIAETIEANPASDSGRAASDAHAVAMRTLAVNPSDHAAWRALARALFNLGWNDMAIACSSRAIELAPEVAGAWADRARVLLDARKVSAALSDIDKALALDGRHTRAWAIRAQILLTTRCFTEALEASDRALALDPKNIAASRIGIHAGLFACDWQRRTINEWRIAEALRTGIAFVSPFNHLAISHSEADNLALARISAKPFPPASTPLWSGERYRHDRIRIAYVSTDFRDSLSVNAIAGCYENHDKSRFETTAISLSPGDGSETRRRIEAAVDRFVDVQADSDEDVARMLREQEIDIAIDLNGLSGDRRTAIFAARPAPVQVNYLGFAGTMAMAFIDYIIADRVVIPEENRAYYTEKVVYLPHSFFPTDRKRRIDEYLPSRTEAGLPQKGFVFACHNTPYKITSEIFDIWMRLLRDIEDSVLWLSFAETSTIENLRGEANNRGVAPERLLFGPRVSQRASHLSRLRLADLFLDTLPYNAHTTGCDALWAGLPLLTCTGNTFPARVATSLLYAAGLPELVTTSLTEYENAARALAQNPERLSAIRKKLLRNRDTAPLFDTARFTRDLESVYVAMWERQHAGLPPASFSVDRSGRPSF